MVMVGREEENSDGCSGAGEARYRGQRTVVLIAAGVELRGPRLIDRGYFKFIFSAIVNGDYKITQIQI